MGIFSKKKKKENFDNFPPIGGLMVSKMITDQGKKPRFMYREKRTRPEDSGWRIFSAEESEEYTNNPDNVGIYAPSTILKMDASIAPLLMKGIGSVYERTSEKSDWYKVYDFEMEDDYMVTHKLTNIWSLNINNLFERRLEEDGSLMYTTGDKSLRLTIWNRENTSKEDIYKEYKDITDNRDQSHAKTLEKYDFSDEKVYKVGYRIKEQDGDKAYDVIYGFSIIENQIIMAAFYFDEEEDIRWATDTWKGMVAEL
ncbi:MAG: DUF2185 domain-containing protein [Dysgonomonas sp.]|nr:DUF2185 domain-containing protein [Dysgonomonas sp.]